MIIIIMPGIITLAERLICGWVLGASQWQMIDSRQQLPIIHKHLTPALSSSPCSVIIPMLCHHFPALSSSPCSVIISILCHHPHALSSSPSSVIIPMLCHHFPVLSSSPCSVIIFLFCHHPHALSSSPCSVCVERTSNSQWPLGVHTF